MLQGETNSPDNSMSNDDLVDFIKLNNDGVHLMQSNELQSAIIILTKGIKSCGRHLAKLKTFHKKTTEDNDEGNFSCFQQNINTVITDFLVNHHKHQEGGRDMTMCIEDHDEYGYLYKYPIPISYQVDNGCLRSNSLVSLIMTFNLALAHHLAHYYYNDDGYTYLQKAAKIYKLASKLQRDEGGHASGDLFVMATLNNLGHVYNMMQDNSEAQRHFRQLLGVVVKIINNSSNKNEETRKLEGFMSNMSQLILDKTVVAAAA